MPEYFHYKAFCRLCRHQDTDTCQTLDFSRMPTKRRDGDTIAVNCTAFESKFRTLAERETGVKWK